MDDAISLAMLPYSVPGTDPGSVYRIVARTTNHYIAARRLSEHAYRIRFARLDNAPLNIPDTTPDVWENQLHFKVGKDWSYMSKLAMSSHAAEDIIARLIRVALICDGTMTQIPNDDTDEGKQIEQFIGKLQQSVIDQADSTETDNNNNPEGKPN